MDPILTRTGGAYIPPAKLRMMQEQITDKNRWAESNILAFLLQSETVKSFGECWWKWDTLEELWSSFEGIFLSEER